MLGVLVDQEVFDGLITQYMPDIKNKLDSLNLNTQLITFEWFVCLYTRAFENTNVHPLFHNCPVINSRLDEITHP